MTAGSLDNTGTLNLSGNATAGDAVATFTVNGPAGNAGMLTIGAGAALDVTGSNQFTRSAGTITVGGTLDGAVSITGGVLELQTGGVAEGPIDFAGNGTLQIDGLIMPAAIIGGVVAGDSIDLRGVAFGTSSTAPLEAGNILQITENRNTYSLHLDPSENFSGEQFELSADTSGDTDITVKTVAVPAVAVAISNADVTVADPTGTVTFTFSQAPVDFSLGDVTSPDGTLNVGLQEGLPGISGGHFPR